VVHTDPIDINCHCLDPTETLVLNPKARQNVPDGQWNPNQSTIRDYRGFRYPTENANFNCTLLIKERVTLNVRAEFSNVFNRTQLPQRTTSGIATDPTISGATGLYYGWLRNLRGVQAEPELVRSGIAGTRRGPSR
jgi:hypothetical protein